MHEHRNGEIESAAPPSDSGGVQGLLDEMHAAGGHVHLLSELQEEVLCWTIACFVLAAIAFAAWTRRAAARLKHRKTPPSGSFTKRRARRKARR